MVAQDQLPSLHILCLGAGRMGSQIGLEYALGGHHVVFVARRVDQARMRVDAGLQTVIEHQLAPEAAIASVFTRVSFRDNLPEDGPVELVIESLPEVRAVKAAALHEAAAWWPEATLATNSSSIPVSELGDLAEASERIVATHYWNPPLLMPLVEMLPGRRTPAWRLELLAGVLRRLGKRPVLLGAEVPGMLWNRLQLALLRECLWLVEHGVATASQIDEVVRDGLARRWRLLGRFEAVSLGGPAVFDAIAENLFPTLSSASVGQFGTYVETDAAVLGKLAERRDLGLAAELAAERSLGSR